MVLQGASAVGLELLPEGLVFWAEEFASCPEAACRIDCCRQLSPEKESCKTSTAANHDIAAL